MKTIINPPDATSLMTSARSFGNYDLAGALADLIDNSITANASNVWIKCLYQGGNPVVTIIDDGAGMDYQTLVEAMRPASTSPASERSPDDLGRFGWGMKSASLSQCKKLTVLTRQEGHACGAIWDLNAIDKWSMGVLTEEEVTSIASKELPGDHGTEIIWNDCDRLSENGSISSSAFNDLIAHAMDQLALVFHRFLEGKARRSKLAVYVNGGRLEPFDPFHTSHNATVVHELESLEVDGQLVRIRPYTLPHFSKLKEGEHERLGGEEGFLRNQGFYVYRNERLIIHGTWFRLAKYGDLTQLIRISVDIPNSMDEVWKITLDKSEAKLPTVLRNRLGQIVAGLKKKSSKVIRSKSGKINDAKTVPVWSRHTRDNELSYSVNRDHPLIAKLLDVEDKKIAEIALSLIERNFPVSAFIDDSISRPEAISQAYTDRSELKRLLDITTPLMLIDCGDDMKAMIRELRRTEPFSSNWLMVKEYLDTKGWN